jgi:hypothetical protein
MELVGYLDQPPKVPIVINWSDEQQVYLVQPLIVKPPEITLPRSDTSAAIKREHERSLGRYLEPVELGEGLSNAYGLSEFSVIPGNYEGHPPYLVGVYRMRTPLMLPLNTPALYERTAWVLEQLGPKIGTGWCRIVPEQLLIKAPPTSPENQIIASFAADVQHYLFGCAAAFQPAA